VLAQVWSVTVCGVEGVPVQVEANVASGLPSLSVVGLPQGAVREGRDRVQSALRAGDWALPPRRITVNLVPGDLKKEGTGFDLPIAMALLAASGQIPRETLHDHAFIGELGLDGAVRSVRGVLPAALCCNRSGIGTLIVPADNLAEALGVGASLRVFGVRHLRELVAHFRGEEALSPPSNPDSRPDSRSQGTPARAQAVDLRDIRGQPLAKRALEIAAAGGHHLLLSGPPGGGKTLLARALPGILPPLEREEALEVTGVHSVAGLLPLGAGLVWRPPFRAPHHTVSAAGLVGGGRPARPGEVSLAHRGVLFLDELGEFSRLALESLRQPLEDGVVTVVRVQERHLFPAAFSLIAAMNPCPCGHWGEENPPCLCDPALVVRYQGRISGPLRDRLDLHVPTHAVSLDLLAAPADGPSSEAVQGRVIRAREVQRKRWAGTGLLRWNSRLGPAELVRWVPLDAAAQRLLQPAVARFGLSPRGIHRVLRVARTVADLEGCSTVTPTHLAEALQFRLPGLVVEKGRTA
jgi:magnesium chelatase family protein